MMMVTILIMMGVRQIVQLKSIMIVMVSLVCVCIIVRLRLV